MKIAYVSLHWPRTYLSGVGKKIRSQIKSWQDLGNEVVLFMHTHNTPPDTPFLDGKRYIYQRIKKSKIDILRTEIARIKAFQKLLNDLKTFNPDIIYLRYGMYVYPLHLTGEIAPFVIEINTNDVSQHKLLGGFYPYYNLFTRGIYFKTSNGFIFTSNELSTHKSFHKFKKPYKVIGNGIDTKNIEILKPPKNKIPRLVFIGSPHQPWNGIEKLPVLAQKHKDIFIDVVGSRHDCAELGGFKNMPDNIRFHGFLLEKDYINLLANADAAIGTLSLYIKNMEEAAPLKIRECAAYGLPLILPFRDTDLDGLYEDTILKIPNREDNIHTHGKAIRDFLYQVKGKRLNTDLVNPLIDLKEKEKTRLAFFQNIL